MSQLPKPSDSDRFHPNLFDQRSAKAFGLSVESLDHAWMRAELSTYVGVSRPMPPQLFMVMRAHNRARPSRSTARNKDAMNKVQKAVRTGTLADPDDLIAALPPMIYPEPNPYPKRRIGRPTIRSLRPVVTNPSDGFSNKPSRTEGLWTSTYLGPRVQSDWVQWCQAEEFPYAGEYRSWVLNVDPDAFVLRITGAEDCDRLHEMGYMQVPERWRSGPAILRRPQLDFEKLAHIGVDGIHLTESGNWQLHLHMRHDFNGWDSESTLWLRWSFTSVRSGPKVTIPVGYRPGKKEKS